MSIEAKLMNKDVPVVKMIGTINNIEGTVFPIFHVSDAVMINNQLCPVYLKNCSQREHLISRLNEWLKKRSISEKRKDVMRIKDIKWDKDSAYPCFFSLSDQYWIQYTEDQKWENMNFFQNVYNRTLGYMSFSKNKENIDSYLLSYNSPDLTTNGILPKSWKRENNINYLIKGGQMSYGQNPVSEILASRMLKKLNIIPFVEYTYEIFGYELCCKSKNFINADTEFVPAWELYSTRKKETEQTDIYDHLMKVIEENNIVGAVDFIDKMIIVDRLMFNFDRHLGNFGFIRDANTGKFIGPAPLFDFGSSFICSTDDIRKSFEFSLKEENRKMYFLEKREKELIMNGTIKPMTKQEMGLDVKVNEIFGLSQKVFDKISENISVNNENIDKMHNKGLKNIDITNEYDKIKGKEKNIQAARYDF